LVSSFLTRLRHFYRKMPDFEEVIVRFENVRQAIEAEKALIEGGFSVLVMPTPSEIKPGCGFCLRLKPEDFKNASAFLSEHGFEVNEAYIRQEPRGGGAYKSIVSGGGN